MNFEKINNNNKDQLTMTLPSGLEVLFESFDVCLSCPLIELIKKESNKV